MIEKHQQEFNAKVRAHNDDIEIQKNQIQQLQGTIKQIKEKNRETMTQINNDAGKEIEQIKSKNMENLSQVRDMGLRSSAELQLTKTKIDKVNKEIERITDQIRNKEANNQAGKEKIDGLREDLKRHSQEIVHKDGIIATNEKKILYLKKKTQELEKFKYVLDYKIKELRRDIAPREQEIFLLRIKTNEMDKELRKYNTINSQLGFMVDDLRSRQETMQEVIMQNRDLIRNNRMYINNFKNAVHCVVQYIDEYDSLKVAVNENLVKYIQD